MRVAIYARISREDKQDATNQLDQLRAWCTQAGHGIVAEYVDKQSGKDGADKRDQLAAMLDAAHKRKFDLVLFWALDRLSREGMAATVGYLSRLNQSGVAFHSYSEPALCSDNELVRDILLAVMSSLAKAERVRISLRTIAGLERVRKHGSRSGRAIGRPAIDNTTRDKITELASAGTMKLGEIARAANCDPKTVKKYLGTPARV